MTAQRDLEPAAGASAHSSTVVTPSVQTRGTGIEWLLGGACGLIVANLYYGQPLNGIISEALGMARQNAGLIMTLPLTGYGVGLLLIVPLGDLLENRRLVTMLLALDAAVLLLASLADTATIFLGLAFLIGLTASVVQLLVPYVTYLVSAERRGRAVGRVVSGVMLGIMLARPISSLVTDLSSWHMIFRLSAAAMAMCCVGLRFALPSRQPSHTQGYGALLASLGHLFMNTEILRRRAFYHASMFGAFSVFWTSVPLWLSGPAFNLSQRGIAWVALAGVAGAIAPPFAGRIADKGLARPATALAMVLAIVALLLTLFAPASGSGVVLVSVCAIALDFAVSANLVFGQRAIYALSEQTRSRMNGLYLATFFAGGAIGSALGAWLYSHFGWPGVVGIGSALPLLGLGYWSTEQPAMNVRSPF